jgi:predicted esterase
MAKLADALYSGCSIRKDVQVQVLFRAPYGQTRTMRVFSFAFSILLYLLFNCSPLQSQDLRSAFQKGRDAMLGASYAEAIMHFEQWSKAVPRDAICHAFLASCHARMNNPQKALQAMMLTVQLGFDDIYLFEADTILQKMVSKHATLAKSMSTIFAGNDDPWIAFLQSAHNQAPSRRFPFAFAEQNRIGRYRILFPKGYDTTRRYSLILLLHGNGLDPAFMLDWAMSFDLSSHIIIAPEAPYLKFNESFHAGTMKFSGRGEDHRIPDSLDDEVINHTAAWYHSIIAHAQSTLPIAEKPALIMGFSQGGFFSTVLLSRYPETFSSAITMCGSQYPSGKVIEHLKNVKAFNRDILIVHGKKDATVPYAIAQQFADALKEAEVNYSMISFEGGHWPEADVLDEILSWVKSH